MDLSATNPFAVASDAPQGPSASSEPCAADLSTCAEACVASEDGDPIDQYFRLRYSELRRLARSRVRGIDDMTLLNATSVLHECYLKLQRSGSGMDVARCTPPFMASVMRSIVVDHVRRRRNERRDRVDSALDEASFDRFADMAHTECEVLLVDAALAQLEESHQRLAAVVEMKFFAGFTEPEIASTLKVDVRTVRRDWNKARGLLRALIRP